MFGKMIRLVCLVPLLVLALLWVSTGSSAAIAQDDPSTEQADVELVGLIEALGTDTLVVNGWMIRTVGAQINTPLELTLAVKVEGNLQVDGSILAREINPVEDDLQPGEVEIVGRLDSLDASTIVVGGLSISVAGAEFKDSVTTGDMVKVHATLSPEGQWVAREVELFGNDEDEQTPDDGTKPEGEFEIVGTLEQISGTTIVVSGQVINIENAEIKDALALGTLVKAHVTLVNNELVAREVESAADSGEDDRQGTQGELELVGVVGEVGGDYLVVSGQSFSTVGAEIKDPLVVGLLVKVHFSQVGGELVAREVEAFDPATDDNGNDNGDDDNGNDNAGGDDNGNDNADDDNGNDNAGGDDNGNDNGDDDNGNDNAGGDDNGNDNAGGDDNGNDNAGGDDNGNDNAGGDDNGNDNSGGGGDDGGGDDNSGGGNGGDDGGGDDNGGGGDGGGDDGGGDDNGGGNGGGGDDGGGDDNGGGGDD